MNETKNNKHKYPPFWEKFIPYFLGAISLAIIVLISIALMVVMGFFPVN